MNEGAKSICSSVLSAAWICPDEVIWTERLLRVSYRLSIFQNQKGLMSGEVLIGAGGISVLTLNFCDKPPS